MPYRIDRLSDSITVAVLREVGRLRGTSTSRAPRSGRRRRSPRSRRICRASSSIAPRSGTRRSALRARARARHDLRARVSPPRGRAPRGATAATFPDSVTYELMRQPSRFRAASVRESACWRRSTRCRPRRTSRGAARCKTGSYGTEEALVAPALRDARRGPATRTRTTPSSASCYADAHSRFDDEIVARRGGRSRDARAVRQRDRARLGVRAGVRDADRARGVSRRRGERAPLHPRRISRCAPSGPRSEIIRLDDALLDPRRARGDRRRASRRHAADGALCDASRLLRHVPDSAEMAVRIGARARRASRRLCAGPRTTVTCTVSQIVGRAAVPRPSARSRSPDVASTRTGCGRR